tara:strand:+ start:878 stop:1087 length:210 start_codon:yes stop_codon:yes gene_type:complete
LFENLIRIGWARQGVAHRPVARAKRRQTLTFWSDLAGRRRTKKEMPKKEAKNRKTKKFQMVLRIINKIN